MDNKHFIWIVPMLLIIGFVVGYISGLNIPKEVTFAIDDKTLEFMNLYMNTHNETFCNPYYTGKSYPEKCQNFLINKTGNYCDGKIVCQN